MKAKIWLWTGLAILLAGLVAGAVWWKMRPQIVFLSDGTKLKLVAVTYGKHHNFPGNRVPVRANRRSGSLDSTNDTLFVWIEQQHKGNQWPNYQLLAYDQSDTACAGNSMMNSRQIRPGDEMVGLRLDAFPRRTGKFYLRIQEWNPQNGRQTVKNGFVVSNPARGPFPAWYPDSLPDTQSDGDLDVTLNKLVVGVKTPWQRNDTAPDDAMNKGVQVAFDVRQNGQTVTNWQPVRIETFDATGNHIIGSVNTSYQDGEPMTFYQWGLWPDEPAWKLRVEMSRTSGFNDDELWTVQDVPVESGKMQNFWNNNPRGRNQPGVAETTLNGVHLKIFPVKQFTDQSPNSQPQGAVQIQADSVPEGMRMTLFKATDDQGHELGNWTWGWSSNNKSYTYSFAFPQLGNSKAINFTIALHKSRFVEFTVKPTKP